MKLAGYLTIPLAVSALAQSSASYGTRIGQVQTAYLEDLPAGIVNALDISDRFREIVGAARSSGAIVGPDGRAFAPAPVTKGPRVEFETWVEQRTRDYAESVVTGFSGIEREAGKATIHRFVRDNFRNIYLTYVVTVEAVPDTETFRVSFSDSSVPVPVPQMLRQGETMAVNLFVDARTGRRMVEYIRVGTALMHARQGVSRDVYAEDAELAIAQPRLRVNGVEQPVGEIPSTLSAPLVRIDIPAQGRYLLSFKPRAADGFERAGEAAENSVVFSLGGNTFRIDCAERIATGSGTYNIYARRDSASDAAGDPALVTFAAQR